MGGSDRASGAPVRRLSAGGETGVGWVWGRGVPWPSVTGGHPERAGRAPRPLPPDAGALAFSVCICSNPPTAGINSLSMYKRETARPLVRCETLPRFVVSGSCDATKNAAGASQLLALAIRGAGGR